MPHTTAVGTGRFDLVVMGPKATKPQERPGTLANALGRPRISRRPRQRPSQPRWPHWSPSRQATAQAEGPAQAPGDPQTSRHTRTAAGALGIHRQLRRRAPRPAVGVAAIQEPGAGGDDWPGRPGAPRMPEGVVEKARSWPCQGCVRVALLVVGAPGIHGPVSGRGWSCRRSCGLHCRRGCVPGGPLGGGGLWPPHVCTSSATEIGQSASLSAMVDSGGLSLWRERA